MITLDHFTEGVKKRNGVKRLKRVIKRVNNGEGYLSLLGNHVVFNNNLTGDSKKDRDRFIQNNMKGIVSFDLSPLNRL